MRTIGRSRCGSGARGGGANGRPAGRGRGPAGVAARVLGSAALLVVATAGCQSMNRGEGAEGPMTSAVRHPTLDDFPVPNGFTLVDDHSQSRTSGSLRMVQYEFSGSTPRGTIARFYKEKLPGAGWTLRHERFDRGMYVLRFESDKEECDLRIRPEGRKTLINVDIGPLAQGSAERLPRPVQHP